jgi:hypothetical protein
MRIRSRLPFPALVAPLLLLGAAACGDDGTSVRISSVEVSPSSATVQALGSTQQFSARAVDPDGGTVSGEEVSWGSADPAVATVTASGMATAVGTGVTSITATIGGVEGSALLTVLEPDPECIDPQTVTLAVGEHVAFGSQECFVLPAGSAGDRYRVVVTRPDSASASSVVQASLTLTELAPVTAAPRARETGAAATKAGSALLDRLSSGDLEELGRSLRVVEATARHHARLRREEVGLARRLAPARQVAAARAARLQARSPALQSAPERIRVDPSTTCSEPDDEVTGLLVYAGEDFAFYQDSAQSSGSDAITPSQARRMADYYAAHGKEVIERYVGSPTDIDGNGRINVFVSPVVTGNVAAWVWSGDLLDAELDQCQASNEGEYIFFNAGTIRRMDNESPNHQALETLVHEVKHVVSLYNRIQASRAARASRFQPLWVEEGTAEIAGNMSSRVAMASTGGVPVGDRLQVADLANSEGRLEVTPENYGVLLRLLRTVRYLSSQPNGLVVSPPGAHPEHSVYGTGWHFHRWLGDAYADATRPFGDAPLFRQLADSAIAPGTGGLLAATGRSFRELFDEYALAIALHGTGAPEGRDGFTSYDFVSATDILCRPGSGDGCPSSVDPQPDGLYPWPVTERSGEPGTSFPAPLRANRFAGPIGPTGIRVHDFRSDGLGDGVQVELSMGAPGRILVVRLR